MLKLLHGYVKVVVWICLNWYMPFFKLLHGFVKVVLCIPRSLPNKTKLKIKQDFKACWSFCFELKVLNESTNHHINVNNSKHCQRHNGPKAMRTLTHSIPLVQRRSLNKLWNLGQTSALFGLAKGEKCIEQFWQIHIILLINPSSNFDKSI